MKTICFIPAFFDKEISDQMIMKDVCVIPSLYASKYNMNCIIAAYKINENKLKEVFPKTQFININETGEYYNDVEKFLAKKAKNINILYVMGPYEVNLYLIKLFKSFNPNGKVYLKCDMNKGWLSRIVNQKFLKDIFELCDLITTESIESKEYMNNTLPFIVDGITNGYFPDEDEVVKYEDKENIILTVGRLGTYQKQTHTLIETFLHSNLQEWKLRLVGSIEPSFKSELVRYKDNELFNKNVEFVGLVTDRKKVLNEYKKAKIFLLTSTIEAFAHSLIEAAVYGCYIITTDVDGAIDITDYEKYGQIKPFGDVVALSDAIKLAINNEEVLARKCYKTQIHARNEYDWNYVVAKLHVLFKMRGLV